MCAFIYFNAILPFLLWIHFGIQSDKFNIKIFFCILM